MAAADNSILQALPPQDHAALSAVAKPIPLGAGALLGEVGAPIEQVVFPTAGLISVVAELASGERIEVALIGRTGVLGAPIVFGSTMHISTSFVQMPGAALSVRAPDLVALARKSERLRDLLFRHEQYLLAQSQQSVGCNARHQISARLATWLMRARDAAEQSRLLLTQEFLAQMLGVQRASVSIEAGRLQDAGLIRYRRGQIDIIDETRLVDHACECCQTVRLQYQRLFGDG